MEETPSKTLPVTNLPKQPSIWKRFWMLGLIPLGALICYLGVTSIREATSHGKDDWQVVLASVTAITGIVTIAVASILCLIRLLPILWQHRHRFRFSLRTLFIVVTIVAVGLGWVLYEAKRQQQVIAELEKLDASIYYASEKPPWLPGRFDIGCLRRIEGIDFGYGTRTSDLSLLKGMQNLQSLQISHCHVGDLSELAGLRELTYLDLFDTQVSDISPLNGLHKLTTLCLCRTQVADVSSLADLRQLEILDLSETQVSNISALVGLRKLGVLDLSHTPVRDVSKLSELTELNRVRVEGTPIREQQLEDLHQLLPRCSIIRGEWPSTLSPR
jgi:hypothetical protein